MGINLDFYNDFTQNFMGAYGYSEYLEKRLLTELAKNKEFKETKEKLEWCLHEFNDQTSVEQIYVAFREIENKYI